MENYNKKEIIDTYDVLTENDKDELLLIKKIRQNVKFFVGRDNIINKMKELVDNSIYFDFLNDRVKRNISKSKPLLILSINYDSLDRKLTYRDYPKETYIVNGLTNPKFNEDIEYLQDLIRKDIIEPLGDFFLDYLKDNDKFNELLKEHNINKNININDDMIKLMSITSVTMFSVKVDMLQDRLFVSYFM